MSEIETLTLPQRVVLLGVATLERDEETPAPVNVITKRAQQYGDEISDLGKLTEARVDAALNTLEAEGVVTVPSMDDTSPVGKGRPAYELGPDVSEILNALAEDDRLSAAIESLETA